MPHEAARKTKEGVASVEEVTEAEA